MFYIFYSARASLAAFVFWRICRNISVASLYCHTCTIAYAQRATPAHHVLPCGSMLSVTHSAAESITAPCRVAAPVHLCQNMLCYRTLMLALFWVKTFCCTCDTPAIVLQLCVSSRISCCNTFDFHTPSQTALCSIRNFLYALFYVAHTQNRQYPRPSPIPSFCCTSCTCVFCPPRIVFIFRHNRVNKNTPRCLPLRCWQTPIAAASR